MDPRIVSRRFGLLWKKSVPAGTEESRIRMLKDTRATTDNTETTAVEDRNDDQQAAA